MWSGIGFLPESAFVGDNMSLVDLLGYVASAAVLARTATVKCRTDCNVIFELTEHKAKELYFQDRSFGFAVLQLIIARLVENNERLVQAEAT